MRRVIIVSGLLLLVSCAPDGEEALALCREDAANVLEVAEADQQKRKNGYIEHCMRTFGYAWNPAAVGCGSHEEFREGAPLSDDPAIAAACFRSSADRPTRFIDYISDWLE